MTKSKFLLISILFFVTIPSFGTEKENLQEPSLSGTLELISETSVGENQINQEIENSNPPFKNNANQKKACHRQKIGPIVIAIVTGVGVLVFVGWAIATNV